MKRCVIFAAMPVAESLREWWENAQFFIAADAGYKTMQTFGITANLLLGDYDSAPIPTQAKHLLCLPSEKDDTDTHYAARKALETDCDEIVILGGIGGRMDHTMANLHTIVFLAKQGRKAFLINETTQITVLLPGTHRIAAQDDCYCSFFPIEAQANGVTLENMKYPLQDATITHEHPIGVSNEFMTQEAIVTVKTGGLYCMICKRE